MHAWFFAPPPAVHLHHQRDQQQHMPSSRVFKYKSDGHVRPVATPASAWSFAQHPDAELGALVGFLAALASNSLPLTIDPSQHIDPELVLGFNTHTGDEKVQAEVENIVDDTWMRNPVVIFSELHSTVASLGREAKSIISEYRLYPEPTVFEVDQRVDAAVLRPLVRRLTGAKHMPVVLVAGLRAARDDGSLATAIHKSAATIDGALVHRKKHH
ncbi:hypothetical protein BKA62DRAFT_746820 [Auriculariales sp. MPI-PUGE-AT-0066]|nr:hypothetical protein BKA62DRAFT_746820 [Auriculariales sp. MPI-PUGE-AT-0066]